MALNDTTVILPGTGFLYTAPNGTAAPANKTAPAAPWENIGHTSREDNLAITREGGDVTVLGTWQNTALRERRDPTTFALTFRAHQADNTTLQFYFGGADVDTADVFGVPAGSPGVIERAMFIRIIDGANELGIYVPKVSIGAEDDIELDVEGLMVFPLRATVLQVSGSNLLDIYNAALGL